jgi:hypothetical protein
LRAGLDGANQLEVAVENRALAQGREAWLTYVAISGLTQLSAKFGCYKARRVNFVRFLRTTAIYGDVIGSEERAFAARIWARRI